MPSTPNGLAAIIHTARRGERDRPLTRPPHALRFETVALDVQAVSKRIALQDARLAKLVNSTLSQWPSPSTPSGRVPVHAKQTMIRKSVYLTALAAAAPRKRH